MQEGVVQRNLLARSVRGEGVAGLAFVESSLNRSARVNVVSEGVDIGIKQPIKSGAARVHARAISALRRRSYQHCGCDPATQHRVGSLLGDAVILNPNGKSPLVEFSRGNRQHGLNGIHLIGHELVAVDAEEHTN